MRRLSTLIAKVEDRVIADAPKAQAKVRSTVARSALSLGHALVTLSARVAPKPQTTEQQR